MWPQVVLVCIRTVKRGSQPAALEAACHAVTRSCHRVTLVDRQAYQRRAAARAEQGDHMGAIADREYAVRLQPESKALAVERAAAIDRRADSV